MKVIVRTEYFCFKLEIDENEVSGVSRKFDFTLEMLLVEDLKTTKILKNFHHSEKRLKKLFSPPTSIALLHFDSRNYYYQHPRIIY